MNQPFIREVQPQAEGDIAWVAARMRRTLVEVLGEERGTALYSMDWLLERVRWHLDPARIGKVFLIERVSNAVSEAVAESEAAIGRPRTESRTSTPLGHAIARVDQDETGQPFGYFSTLYIEPESRRQGLAAALIAHVENWFREQGLPRMIYNTAANHSRLIRLFERHGYRITLREGEMVQLTKVLE